MKLLVNKKKMKLKHLHAFIKWTCFYTQLNIQNCLQTGGSKKLLQWLKSKFSLQRQNVKNFVRNYSMVEFSLQCLHWQERLKTTDL